MRCQPGPYGKGCVICMYSIGVIGDYDSICGFAALGLDIYPIESAEQAEKVLKMLAGGEYGIIYITEPIMEQLKNQCARYNDEAVPAIIPIPACTGITGFGKAQLKSCVEQAVGSDIIFNEDEV